MQRTTSVESEAPRRNETPRQGSQLPRDVQEFRLRPIWSDELDTDGKSILRCAERYDECRMTTRIERRNVWPAVVVVGPRCAIEIKRASLLAALESRTIRNGCEQCIVAAEEALDVFDPHTLHPQSRGIVLRIHPKRATQQPHHIRLPLEQSPCDEHREDLAHQQRHVLSDGSAKQLHEHFAGAGVDRRRGLLHTSTRTFDPIGQCCQVLARLCTCDVRLEPIGPCEAQLRERPVRSPTPVDRCDLEIGRVGSTDDRPQLWPSDPSSPSSRTLQLSGVENVTWYSGSRRIGPPTVPPGRRSCSAGPPTIRPSTAIRRCRSAIR
jgi:hypothetical protein